MFKKSVIELVDGLQSSGKLVFQGYTEVRDSPQFPPRNLKQRIKAGEDVISIWFHHIHTGHFRDIFERSGIRISPKGARRQGHLPTIHEMATEEILEFCKSIDVHPAHLVPLDNEQELSLPTPLLELLIDMAYDGKSSQGLTKGDVYLASTAIAYECKRIRSYMEGEKREAFDKNGRFSALSQIFTEALSDPNAMKHISKTTMVTPSTRFSGEASRSYPYIDRVHDLAVIELEKLLTHSYQSVDLKKDVLQERIGGFVKLYQKLINPEAKGDVEAKVFLSDIIDALKRNVSGAPSSDIVAIGSAVEGCLGKHETYQKRCKIAQNVYRGIFGRSSGESSGADQQYLQELDSIQFHELVLSVKVVLDGEANLIASRRNHEEREGYYIRKVGEIRRSFDEVGDGYRCNLLNNRVLLSLHNINVKENISPQASPK